MRMIRHLVAALSAGLLIMACAMNEGPEPTFSTPQKVADALVEALQARDHEKLETLLTSQYIGLLPVDEVDEEAVALFTDSYREEHQLDCIEEQSCMLNVGKEGWVFPIPIVNVNSQWSFDVRAGTEIIRFRQIGKNEIATIQAVLAYYDAQLEYAKVDHDGDGVLEYAQKIISEQGKEDGLYYDSPKSPLGHLYLDHKVGSYNGYRFKILTAQGEHARYGRKAFVKDGKMTEGFALIAWPDSHGEDGVMSFIINQDGIIYEKDLGEKSTETAEATTVFDPDASWHKVEHKYAYPEDFKGTR